MEVQIELETLRREVSELRDDMQRTKTRHDDTEQDVAWKGMSQRMKQEMEKENRPASVGVQRSAVYLQLPDNHSTMSSETIFGHESKLPDEEKLIDFCNALNNPVGLRAMDTMFKGVYAGRWLSMNRADLAAALGISEPDMEGALRPLVANGMLRWGKNADGTEYFQLDRPDVFATLLTFV
jgi:hypothetical protein